MFKLAGPVVESPGVEPHWRDRTTNATRVTAMIVDRPTCLECIAKACFLPTTDAAELVLAVIRRAVEVYRHDSYCRACAKLCLVFSVNRPSA
jgi:hypothetical protein